MRIGGMTIAELQALSADSVEWRERQGIVKKTIALDFDGVLHRYSKGWQDGMIYDEPVDGAADACWELDARGFILVVFTARQQPAAIEAWLKRHNFPQMGITNTKPPALFYIDDRGIRFTDWQQCLHDVKRLLPTAGEP